MTAPADWYPNPEETSEWRYWDGRAWTDQVYPMHSATSPAPQLPISTPEKPRRRVPLWVAITAGITGLIIGGSSASANGTSSEYSAEITQLELQLSQTEKETAKATQLLQEAQDDFATEKSELVLQLAEANKLKDEATQKALAAEAQLVIPEPAAPAPVPFASTPAPPPAPNVYYQNCTDARNSGGAPVYAGQPGYGRHLDRDGDGDGVGCE